MLAMSDRPVDDRSRAVRQRRTGRESIRRIAHDFGISPTRVRQILADTGGDPAVMHGTDADLERERDRLQDRIRADRKRLRLVIEELESRETDRILGV